MCLTVGSLFAGIGGFDLGLERAGMKVKWQVEIDEYCVKILEKHWPQVRRFGDIKQLDASELEPVDVLCGGFPCQPASTAGSQKGTEDERWLWPEFLKLIRSLRPRWVVAENVPGLLSVNAGRAFGEVVGDLAQIGYDIEWDCLPAATFGAPHRRDRVWIVAHPNGSGQSWTRIFEEQKWTGGPTPTRSSRGSEVPNTDDQGAKRRHQRQEGPSGVMADTNSPAQKGDVWHQRDHGVAEASGLGRDELRGGDAIIARPTAQADNAAMAGGTESTLSQEESHGGHHHWSIEPRLGRVVDGVPNRMDRLKGLGNAIVPQIAEWIGLRIIDITERNQT